MNNISVLNFAFKFGMNGLCADLVVDLLEWDAETAQVLRPNFVWQIMLTRPALATRLAPLFDTQIWGVVVRSVHVDSDLTGVYLRHPERKCFVSPNDKLRRQISPRTGSYDGTWELSQMSSIDTCRTERAMASEPTAYWSSCVKNIGLPAERCNVILSHLQATGGAEELTVLEVEAVALALGFAAEASAPVFWLRHFLRQQKAAKGGSPEAVELPTPASLVCLSSVNLVHFQSLRELVALREFVGSDLHTAVAAAMRDAGTGGGPGEADTRVWPPTDGWNDKSSHWMRMWSNLKETTGEKMRNLEKLYEQLPHMLGEEIAVLQAEKAKEVEGEETEGEEAEGEEAEGEGAEPLVFFDISKGALLYGCKHHKQALALPCDAVGDDGIVLDWDVLERCMRDALATLSVDPQRSRLLIAESTKSTPAQKSRLAQLVFSSLGVQGCCVVLRMAVGLAALGSSNGLVCSEETDGSVHVLTLQSSNTSHLPTRVAFATVAEEVEPLALSLLGLVMLEGQKLKRKRKKKAVVEPEEEPEMEAEEKPAVVLEGQKRKRKRKKKAVVEPEEEPEMEAEEKPAVVAEEEPEEEPAVEETAVEETVEMQVVEDKPEKETEEEPEEEPEEDPEVVAEVKLKEEAAVEEAEEESKEVPVEEPEEEPAVEAAEEAAEEVPEEEPVEETEEEADAKKKAGEEAEDEAEVEVKRGWREELKALQYATLCAVAGTVLLILAPTPADALTTSPLLSLGAGLVSAVEQKFKGELGHVVPRLSVIGAQPSDGSALDAEVIGFWRGACFFLRLLQPRDANVLVTRADYETYGPLVAMAWPGTANYRELPDA
jgi:hypothetical protein